MSKILNWDLPKEGEEYPLEQGFRDLRDSAVEKQKAYPVGSLVYQQYQTFIDVGNNLIEMCEESDKEKERRHQDKQNRLEESEAWGDEFPELK